MNLHNRPLASAGLTSYRCASRYGWIMIGAADHADALIQARRTWIGAAPTDLQIWSGVEYVPLDRFDTYWGS